MYSPLLQLQNVTFGFSPENTLFDKLTFNLEQSKIYALMGGNGSGKTTLFNLITGFHKIKTGSIHFKQHNITSLPPYKINRIGIARTFQDLRLIAKLNVKENILLAMPNHPTDSCLKALLPTKLHQKQLQQLDQHAEHLMEHYFLQDIKHAPAHEISFGQQKLLNLACCVANGAELLLLDEPVAGISPQYREQISFLVQQLKQQGKTILLIEHHTDFIAETADSILFLSDGKLAEFNNLEQLKNHPQARYAYF